MGSATGRRSRVSARARKATKCRVPHAGQNRPYRNKEINKNTDTGEADEEKQNLYLTKKKTSQAGNMSRSANLHPYPLSICLFHPIHSLQPHSFSRLLTYPGVFDFGARFPSGFALDWQNFADRRDAARGILHTPGDLALLRKPCEELFQGALRRNRGRFCHDGGFKERNRL